MQTNPTRILNRAHFVGRQLSPDVRSVVLLLQNFATEPKTIVCLPRSFKRSDEEVRIALYCYDHRQEMYRPLVQQIK